jgi:hypothetical protein
MSIREAAFSYNHKAALEDHEIREKYTEQSAGNTRHPDSILYKTTQTGNSVTLPTCIMPSGRRVCV